MTDAVNTASSLDIGPADSADAMQWPTFDQRQQAANDSDALNTASCNDHFVMADGELFAGTHLIADFWGCDDLDDLEKMETAMRRAVDVAGATLLHIHLHHFTPNGGISGVAVLAESHISVHTWPERRFAAFDVFMCGDAQPQKAIDVLVEDYSPAHSDVMAHRRGRVSDSA